MDAQVAGSISRASWLDRVERRRCAARSTRLNGAMVHNGQAARDRRRRIHFVGTMNLSHRLVYKDRVRTPSVEVASASRTQGNRRSDGPISGAAFPLAAALLAIPFIVAVLSLVGYHWYPSSDLALEALRIKDVGGRHTPLVGMQSRFDWSHPGPLMFWVFAPIYRLLGNTGLLAGAAILNAGAVVGTLFVARRRGGPPMVAIVAVLAAVLIHALGPELVIQIWNPWVPVLPFLLYVLLAWSVAEQDWVALPWLVGIGSFVVQSHVSYAPLVLGLGLLSCALGAWGFTNARRQVNHRETNANARLSARRWIAIAGIVGVLLWAAPVAQQFTGSPGNLGAIVESFRHPRDPSVGWATAFGVIGRELGFVGPWITGDETGPFGTVATASAIPATLLVVATAGLGAMAWRRGARDAGRLALLAVAGAGLSVLAVSRITGVLGSYLVRWTWIIAALVWLSMIWSLWAVLVRSSATNALVAAALVTVGGLVASTAWSASSVTVPGQQFSDAVARLDPRVARQLDRGQRYRVTAVDSENVPAPMGIAMFQDLEDRGQQVRVEPRLSRALGTWRTARRFQVAGVIFVVAGVDIEGGWTPPTGSRRIAAYDPLSPRERARAGHLEREVRDRLGSTAPNHPLGLLNAITREQLVKNGADPRAVDELAHLRQKGDRYTVYLAPAATPPPDR